MSRVHIALSVLGVLLVSAGIAVVVWSMLSEEGIAADVGDALSFDAEDAAEYGEKHGEELRQPGERLIEHGCASGRSRTYRCWVRFDSGRRVSFWLRPTADHDFRVVKAPQPN